MKNIRVGSMFAGIGGICLGFKQADFDVVWANERDRAACNTYRKNFGNSYLQESDISKVNPNLIPDFDILAAGFPCQPFSIAGRQKGFKDPRGNMFFEIARIADIKKPEIIFLENVANLREHDNGRTFLVIYNTLAELGYSVRYKIMSATEYGNLPQTRSRIFIIAFKDDIACDRFSFPEPILLEKSINNIIDRSNKKHEIYYYTGKKAERLAKHITDRNSIYQLTDYGIRKVKNNMCPTLTASMGTYPDRVPIVCDDFGIRKLTLRECLDFQGFPKEFKFPSNITIDDAYKQIGNSVAVPVVKRLGNNLKEIYNENYR